MPSATSNGIESLANRLTNTQDRETYSELMCYLNRLPPGDEFRQLAELLGLLSLVGQRIPDALAEFLMEFRLKAEAETEYCAGVEARLANLPKEIAEGVDTAGLARAMSESLRQQLAASGLQETAALLKAAAVTLKSLSSEINASLKPIAATLSDESKKLLDTTCQIETMNANLLERRSVTKRCCMWLFGIAVILLGALSAEVSEMRHTEYGIDSVISQLHYIEKALTDFKKH